MTRDSLRQFEGQLVIFNGRLADVSRPRNDTRDYLLTTVRCWSWDGDSAMPLSLAPDAAVDHAWLRLNLTDQPRTELLQRVEGVATVGWYTRANGSVDLGLRSHPAVNLDDVLARLHEARTTTPRAELIDQLERLVHNFTAPGHYGYSQHLKASEVLKELNTYRARLLRSQAAEERIKATAKPGRRATSAGSFRDLLKSA